MACKHLTADLTSLRSEPLRIAYLDQPSSPSVPYKGTVLLIHGFPQTSYQFRDVLPLFSKAGYRSIAPDYRGAGGSSKPHSNYLKTTLAADLVALLDHLHLTDPVHLIGHDIGGMVAFALATRHAARFASVCWGECPLPGTSAYVRDRTLHAVEQFHFLFHAVPDDLALALVSGREHLYLAHFFTKLAHNLSPWRRDPAVLQTYVDAYSHPAALRAAFALYSEFENDAAENTAWIAAEGKCALPSLVLSGEMSRLASVADEMAREVSVEVSVPAVKHPGLVVDVVPGAGHYVAEENAEGFVEVVLRFWEGVVVG